MVDYCLKNKIIEPYQIKYVVLSSLSIPYNYHNDFIKFCDGKLGKYGKFSINSMIGAFNINVDKNLISSTLGVIKNGYNAKMEWIRRC